MHQKVFNNTLLSDIYTYTEHVNAIESFPPPATKKNMSLFINSKWFSISNRYGGHIKDR